MSERDELRERLIALLQDSNLPDWLADDRRADGEIKADAVLAEIERTHVLVPLERAAELEAIETAARGLFEGDHGDAEELWVDRAAGDRLMELFGVE